MKHSYVLNHDGFGVLAELASTAMTEQDAADLLVRPLAGSAITAIDWGIMSTAEHNCRTRHGFAFDGIGAGRELDGQIGRVVAAYNSQPLDLLDIVVKHGHAVGVEVFANVRLNHCLNPDRMAGCPGSVNFCHYASIKKDFRDRRFQRYLVELFEDLLEKGVDGISLDFERKAPFFPPGVDDAEKLDACIWFMRTIRKLTSKAVIVRVAHDLEKGRAQGQDPFVWMEEGLVDVVIPATHNHEPDTLDWGFSHFLVAAKGSPRPCQVWPQIWPTGIGWSENAAGKHPPQAIINRTRGMIAGGARGVYYFNFCCYHRAGKLLSEEDENLFRNLKGLDV